jgi:A nuclease family of the HNH/ENDO VII superfamily with conserved AHH
MRHTRQPLLQQLAHHIVAGTESIAQPARDLFVKCVIKIFDPSNGVLLPKNAAAQSSNGYTRLVHPKCDTYYEGVNITLAIGNSSKKWTRDSLRKALQDQLKTKLLNLNGTLTGANRTGYGPALACKSNGGDGTIPANVDHVTDEDHD